ncbi:MAG: hypothetical protein WBP58_09255 [Chitinophagaceae bacterium]
MSKRCFLYWGRLAGVCLCILLAGNGIAADSTRALLQVTDIIIKGNEKTKSGIILRELGFEKGKHLAADQLPSVLLRAKQQLLNTSLFLTASVQHILLDSQQVQIEVAVKERWYFFPAPLMSLADKNFNLWWNEQNRDLGRVNAGVALEYKNMTGNNDRLAFGAQFGYSQILGMSYHRPNIGRSKQHGLGGRVSYIRNREVNYGSMYDRRSFIRSDEYIRQYFEARVYYTYRRKVNVQHYFSIALFHENIADTVAKVNPEYLGRGLRSVTYPEFTYRFQYQKLNNLQYPLYGQMFQAELSRSLGINHHIDITQLRLEAGYFRRIFPQTYISLFAMTRIYLPIRQPFVRARGLGYSSKEVIRGLDAYVLDGNAFVLSRINLKRKLFSTSVKMPLLPGNFKQIPMTFFAKSLADLGYVSNPSPGNNMLVNRLLFTYGWGIDLVSYYDINMSVEYGINQWKQRGINFRVKFGL